MNFMSFRRLLALTLCMTLLLSVFIVPSASAAVSYKTIKKSTATFECNTANTTSLWKKASTVKFYNTSLAPIKFTAKASGCTVSPSTVTVQPGSAVTFTIKTSFGKVGTTTISLQNTWGGYIDYGLTSSGVRTIVRTK